MSADEMSDQLFTALDHPAISCFDVQKQIDWYCRTLGLRLIRTDGKSPASVLLGYSGSPTSKDFPPGGMLELMPVKNLGPRPADVPRFCPGLRHIAFRVSDFDAAYERLKAAGVEFLFEPGIAVGGGRVVSFRDPEGNELQIVQR